jgi:hypothetical protein
MDRLNNQDLFPRHEIEISNSFDKADVTLLERVHCPEYIAFVNNLAKKISIDSQKNKDGGGAMPVPFTPMVQKFLTHRSAEEVKNGDICDTAFSQVILTLTFILNLTLMLTLL